MCRAVESGLHCPVEIVGLSYGVDVARTALIISVDDALTNPLRQCCHGCLLVVYGCDEFGHLLEFGYGSCLDSLDVEIVLCKEGVVEIEAEAY